MANVFVSHRSSDTSAAERLATYLRSVGHTVWLDTWEINLGDSIVAQMNEGLEGMSYLVLCYSPAGTDAPWINREWQSTLARQLEGKPVRILPVLLAGGEVPAILADIKYANLTADWDTGVAQLASAIR